MSTASIDALVSGYRDIVSTSYVGVACISILLYDHFLTFDDEVEFVWMRRKGIIGALFLINRYLTPFGFIINLIAYSSPLFTPEMYVLSGTLLLLVIDVRLRSCAHFVKYEGAFTTVSLSIAALMMIVRMHALYGGYRGVTLFLLTVFAAQVGIQAWLLSGARAVPHPSGVISCTMIFSSEVGGFASAYAWMPLFFDTIVLILTIHKTLAVVRSGAAGNVVITFVRDGILYYLVIFCANLAFAVMLVVAPDGIKGIAAQFEQLITVTMMSRITINLKKESSASGSNSTFSWASKPNGYSPSARDISFNNAGAAWRQLPRKNIVKAERLFGVPPIPTNVTLAHDDTFELSIMVDKEVTILRE